MPDMDKANLIFLLAKGFEHSVYAVPGQTEDHVHTPGEQPLYKYIRRIGHPSPPKNQSSCRVRKTVGRGFFSRGLFQKRQRCGANEETTRREV
jgi:hypothetical protein